MRRGAAPLLVLGAAVVVASEFVVIGLVPAMSTAMAIGPAQAGLLVALFAVAAAIGGPLLVVATARFPPSMVLTAALLPFAASLILLLFPSFAAVAALRVAQGAALPLFMSIAGAQLARARGTAPGVALLYVGVTVGGMFAPPAGAYGAAMLGWQAPMAAIGMLALAVALGCQSIDLPPSRLRRGNPWRMLTGTLVPAHLLLSTLLFATMFASYSYLTLLLGSRGLGVKQTALALVGFGLAGLAGNWLAGRIGRRNLSASQLVVSIVAGAVVWIVTGAGNAGPLLGVVVLAWGAAHSAGFVLCQVRLMTAMPEAPGFGSALNMSAANLGIAVGSLSGGRVIDGWGIPALVVPVIAFAVLSTGVVIWIVSSDGKKAEASAALPCGR